MVGSLCGALALTLVVGIRTGVAQERRAPPNPAGIAWQRSGPLGTRYALVEGRPELPGSAFRFAMFLPAGYTAQQRHTAGVSLLVISGRLCMTFMDRRSAQRCHGPGAYVRVEARRLHQVAVREAATILVSGFGPFFTISDPSDDR